MISLKVCGMKYPDNIREVASLQPDYLGFIFHEGSARYFEDEIPKLRDGIKTTGVFVNASVEKVLEKASKHELKAVQLHGDESPAYCTELKEKLEQGNHSVELLKVFSVDEKFDLEELDAYEDKVDFFLFDTRGKQRGGNGIPFNWDLLLDYDSSTPFFLSGGIGPDDIQKIKNFIDQLHQKGKASLLRGLDVNSCFESEPGRKKPEDLMAFQQELQEFLNKKNSKYMSYHVNEKGYYGDFGGAFIPEMLYTNVEDLRTQYLAIMQEESFQKEFRQLLKDYVGRPTPLYFAERLSATYNTRIYLKREDLCHTGAHKINNTIGQILMAKRLGKTRIIAETGAGQHGVATATVCALMGLECVVYMGEIDIERQAPNVARMKMLGASIVPAKSGSKTLKDATNEAIRDWINNPVDTHYIIGSVVGPHPYPDMVARFQSIISEEVKAQLLEMEGRENPDQVIACVGGGSNAAGMFYHYLDSPEVGIIAVEAAGKGVESGESAATTILGTEGIIHGSKTLLMQTGDGQITEPYSISAGLDYPGVGPMHANLFRTGRAEFMAITDDEAMAAGLNLSKTEGIIPAIESAHALAVLEKRTFEKEEVVVINLSGRGDKDLNTYIRHFDLA